VPRTNSSKYLSKEKKEDDLMIYLVLWQRGLVEREINELLRGLTRDNDEINKLNHVYKSLSQNEDEIDVEQRPVDENDVCPICQEEFLIKKLPITYCRLVKKER
jgi:E3 ubiquitin-protein ligase ZSWIM2